MANLIKIKEICNRKNITLKELALKVGITEMGLQRIIKTNSTKVDTIEKIAKELNVPIETFFSDKTPKSEMVSDFALGSLSRMLIKRYDKFSDKLAMLKDYYVWEVMNRLSKDEILEDLWCSDDSIGNLIDTNVHSDAYLVSMSKSGNKLKETPYSKMGKSNKELFSSSKHIFKGFYFVLFSQNILNITDYLHEGLIKDKEVIAYWDKYNEILKISENI